jgi:hypothetical protein
MLREGDSAGILRAAHGKSTELSAAEHGLHHFRGHHAVVLAVAAAADREIGVRIATERK